MFVFLFLSFYVIGPRYGDKQKKKKLMWNCPFYMVVSNHILSSPTITRISSGGILNPSVFIYGINSLQKPRLAGRILLRGLSKMQFFQPDYIYMLNLTFVAGKNLVWLIVILIWGRRGLVCGCCISSETGDSFVTFFMMVMFSKSVI